VYDLLLELAWREEPVDLPLWLRDFARRSYGRPNAGAEQAWALLHETVYQAAFDNAVAYTAVPSLERPPATPYNNDRLLEAGRCLLAAADDLRDADSFRFDLVNVTRQALGNHAAGFHQQVIAAYERKDRDALRRAAAGFRGFLEDLDALLATRPEFLLGRWLEDARRWGRTDAERRRLEWNARRVLTLWGNTPALRDYASRQWSGMLTGFYLKRWDLFFERLDQTLARGDTFHPDAFLADLFEFEKNWADATDRYPDQPRGDSVELARKLWAKYAAPVNPKP
jgi:alpha-N-acetylglucosaminidase